MMEAAASINRHMLTLDPPDHTRLRNLIHKAFTPRMIRELEARIREITDELIDGMLAKGSADFIADFAFPLPVTVIAELLGIPREDRDRFRHWSQTIIMGGTSGADFEAVGAAALEFIMYFHEQFDARREQPKDDLITALVQAEEAGDKLDQQELISMVFLLLVAGHETTVNLLGNGMLALMEHPVQKAQLAARPELMRTAVDELLRYDGPVGVSTMRWALEDVEYYGEHIKAGEMVVASLLSANRDPSMFANPNDLDLARTPNKHIAFGNGIHYCVGAPLARMEGAVAFEMLLNRLPKLTLAVDADRLEWNPTVLLHGMKHMPVTIE
jgi:cytochrome P450 PksS